MVEETSKGPPDFYGVDKLLTEEERGLRDRVRAFVDADVWSSSW